MTRSPNPPLTFLYRLVQAEATWHADCMAMQRRRRGGHSDAGDAVGNLSSGQLLGFGLTDSGSRRRSIPVRLESADAGFGLAGQTGSDANHPPCNNRPHMLLSVMLIDRLARTCFNTAVQTNSSF